MLKYHRIVSERRTLNGEPVQRKRTQKTQGEAEWNKQLETKEPKKVDEKRWFSELGETKDEETLWRRDERRRKSLEKRRKASLWHETSTRHELKHKGILTEIKTTYIVQLDEYARNNQIGGERSKVVYDQIKVCLEGGSGRVNLTEHFSGVLACAMQTCGG